MYDYTIATNHIPCIVASIALLLSDCDSSSAGAELSDCDSSPAGAELSDRDSSSGGAEVAADTEFWILSATIYDRAHHVEKNCPSLQHYPGTFHIIMWILTKPEE